MKSRTYRIVYFNLPQVGFTDCLHTDGNPFYIHIAYDMLPRHAGVSLFLLVCQLFSGI